MTGRHKNLAALAKVLAAAHLSLVSRAARPGTKPGAGDRTSSVRGAWNDEARALGVNVQTVESFLSREKTARARELALAVITEYLFKHENEAQHAWRFPARRWQALTAGGRGNGRRVNEDDRCSARQAAAARRRTVGPGAHQ